LATSKSHHFFTACLKEDYEIVFENFAIHPT